MHERVTELLRESIRGQKPSWKNALTRAFLSKMDPYCQVPDTFRDVKGREYTVLRDPRYKIPIALPTGIYNMFAEISQNSITTYAQRKDAAQKYYKALREARGSEKPE